MNQTDIEKTLKRIIEIDVETLAVKKEIEALQIEWDREMKKAARELDLELMKQARGLGKIERELILSGAEEEIAKLKMETDAICRQMQKVSDFHVEELVNEVFGELIGKHINRGQSNG